MSMCTIMQPTYLPWIGYYGLMLQVDSFVFLDTAQVVKRYWDVRNRIKTTQGELYLTVPLKKTQHRDETIFTNALISYESNWVDQHLKSILYAYKKAPFFEETYQAISTTLGEKHETLADLNISLIANFASKLHLECKFYRTSKLEGLDGKKDGLLVQICKKIQSQSYLSPIGASVYIESDSPGGVFKQQGISLSYQNFNHPEYPQQSAGFLPYMSAIDAFMNLGYEKTRHLIQQSSGVPLTSEQVRELQTSKEDGL